MYNKAREETISRISMHGMMLKLLAASMEETNETIKMRSWVNAINRVLDDLMQSDPEMLDVVTRVMMCKDGTKLSRVIDSAVTHHISEATVYKWCSVFVWMVMISATEADVLKIYEEAV